jgi:hypothetical protein
MRRIFKVNSDTACLIDKKIKLNNIENKISQ